MSLDEVRQYYPNITCIEAGGSVQYVINNPEENGTQFESQQILLSSDQHIVLNTTENQQIIIDQSQLQYGQANQQYIVQDNDMVTEYQPAEIVNNQQQIYYTTTKQHVIQQQTTPTPIMSQSINQNQLTNQQILNNTRVVAQPQQQLNNTHVMVQRRIVAPQSITPQRPVQQQQSNVGVRLQYALQQPEQNQQQTQQIINTDDNQLVLNEGRYMTISDYHQELARQQDSQQVVLTPQSVQQQNCADKDQYKQPQPKRSYKRTNNGRGNISSPSVTKGRGRGTVPQQPVQTNNTSISSKPFPQVNTPQQQATPRKPTMQYSGAKPQPRTPGIQQQSPRAPLMQLPNVPQQPLRPVQQYPSPRVQPLIPLSPHVHNGQLQQQSPGYSPGSNQGQSYNVDDSSSSMSDEYKDSARMLVCLENGEQRLITFTLPKESCTVQDLLEQVGVPFNSDTKIECIANPGSDIDYIVNVGVVQSSPFPIEAQQVLTVDNFVETQDSIVSQSSATPETEALQLAQQKPTPTSTSVSISTSVPEPPLEPEKPEPPKILPKYIPGYLAVCNHCGYLSEDFNRCQRCKTRLPEDIKTISTKTEQKPEPEKKVVIPPVKTPPVKPVVAATVTPTTNAKSTPKNPRGKKKVVQEIEPVVLTVSSDEEDNVSKPGNLNSLTRTIDNPVTLSAIQKEPIIRADCDEAIELEYKEGGGKDEEVRSNVPLYTTTLPCRTVRIGSYRFMPREEVFLSSTGVQMFVPVIGDPNQTYKLFIPIKYIIKVLGNFSKALPVLFLYVTPSIGALIRKNIKMEEGSEFYFDPLSKEDPYKRITLLPETVCEETKEKIKKIYLTTPYKMLEELTPKEANDILIRTCPREGGIPRVTVPPPVSFTELRQLLIYPPGKGGIAINAEDYLCLAQDQFLNDVIIDFYLKYLVTDVLAPSMQEKVYIFSSFFYKRLTTKPVLASKRSNPYEVDPNLSQAEKRHCRVKSWTKNVNIFEKDYIIIPINENSHWFLAIICFPGLEGCRSMLDENKVIKVPAKEKKKTVNAITIGNTTITTLKDDKTKIEKPIKCDDEEGSDRDEAEGDESELEDSENDSEQDDQQPEKKSAQREAIKQPCILIFDSLAGASRCRVVATLRDYLTYEHRTKLNSNKTFNKDNIKGACPKVPQQMNFTDCGLYVLQYVESFFQDPIKDYHIPMRMLTNWFEEIVVTRKREGISNLIKELMRENNKDPSILPDIQFPTINGELISNIDSHFNEDEAEVDEEEEDEEEEEHIQSSGKSENSLVQISTMYNSDSSSESPLKLTESVVAAGTALSATSTFIVSSVNSAALKPDLSETKKSNRDTMSYLKSKRISRHRHQDTNDNKKQKID